MIVIFPETRMMGLPYGEEIMTAGRTLWTQRTSVTDRRTDRQTANKLVTYFKIDKNQNIVNYKEQLLADLYSKETYHKSLPSKAHCLLPTYC